MKEQEEQQRKSASLLSRNRRAWPYVLVGALVASFAIFIGGVFAGRWAVKNHVSERIQATLRSRLDTKPPNLDVSGEWSAKNTGLVKLETSLIFVPGLGGGGGIQPMDDGRILYATRVGEFGVIEAYGSSRVLPFAIEMNLDALKRHPVFQLKNFNEMWFRATDINLARIGPGRYELLVGHHYFEPQGACVELRLSRAVISVTGTDISLTEPFRTLLTTKPCITFNHWEYVHAFEGHLTGGKIARVGGDQVLFSTGDHGWVGVRGYPAVSQDDGSTLGKILLVNVSTNEVSIFAKGFRNPQGLTVDSRGRIWETEQGPRGGDELNLIVKGQNYGWPDSTYGTDYGPAPWPLNAVQGRHDQGVTPQFAWNPSIASTGLIEVTGNEFPLWKGDLLVASLRGEAIHRLRLDGTHVVYDEPINLGARLRDIVELPTGHIAVLSEEGALILLRNSDAQSKAPFLDVSRQQQRTADMSAEDRAFAVAGRYAKGAETVTEVSKHLSATAARGELAFKANCAGCHSLESLNPDVGPSLMGVIGRRVGSTDFDYSVALAGRREVWSSSRIVDFAVNPNGIYAGTTMEAVTLTPDIRRDLEGYLEASVLSHR